MDEIKKLHELNLEWGCITNLLDRIINIEESIEGGWPELIEMVTDAMTEEGQNDDPASVFFNLYGFMFRLYYRVKNNPTKQPFNRYSYDEKNRWFMIYNYDYHIYKWALEHGFGEGISGSYMTIPEEKLDDTQKSLLKKRCK